MLIAIIMIELLLSDGSMIRGTLQSDVIIETTFGTLRIPPKEIIGIQFGVHCDDEVAVDKLIKHLGADAYQERENATLKLITLGRQSLPYLPTAHKDMEVMKRTARIKASIIENDSKADSVPYHDTITTRNMVIIGKIKGDSLKVDSKLLGTLPVKLSDCRKLGNVGGGSLSSDMDSSRGWLDTNLVVSRNLNVTATGNIELWSQGPGQYVCSPKGYNTLGKGGKFMAGSLIGKIGVNGSEFYIGESFSSKITDKGNLYLMVVESPWNSPVSGTLKINIRSQP